jgi:hypothetical protein
MIVALTLAAAAGPSAAVLTQEQRRALVEQGAKQEGVPGPIYENERVGQLALTSRMPQYPHRIEGPTPVADQLDAHGLPMYVQTFVTHDDPHQVLEYFKSYFKTLNLPAMGNGDLERPMPYPSITVFDQINGVDLSVIAIPDGASRLTLVVESLSDFRAYEQRMGQANASRYGGLPPYPTGIGPSAVASYDESQRTETVLFTTHDPLSEVIEYYVGELGKQGFAYREEQGSDANDRELTFTGPHQTWHFLASPRKAGPGTQVMATSESRRPADSAPTQESGP